MGCERTDTVPQNYYPVALDLLEKPCLVVGGGEIADGKLDALLDAGAAVTVVSPEVRPRISALSAEGKISLHLRPYQSGEVEPFYLVIAATDDFAANAAIAAEARLAGVIVNAVDDPPNCDFFAVSVVRRRDLQVSISTNGLSPAFARWMREHLDETLPDELGDLLDVLGEVRATLKENKSIPAYEFWKAAIDDELFEDLRNGRRQRARDRVYSQLTRPEALASVGTLLHR